MLSKKKFVGGSHPRLLYDVLSGLSFRGFVVCNCRKPSPEGAKYKRRGVLTPGKNVLKIRIKNKNSRNVCRGCFCYDAFGKMHLVVVMLFQ